MNISDYTEILKMFKELAMQFGLLTTVFALTACVVVLLLVWRLPVILQTWFDGQTKLARAKKGMK